MGGETSMGGAGRGFPPTRWSRIREAKDRSSPSFRRAIDELCREYWKPVYAYIRAARRPSNEEAKDLTQEFFLEIVEGELLDRFSPERGSFRAYLRGALRLFLLAQGEKAGALKRGGGRRIVPLDEKELARMRPAPGAAPEEEFDRQWARSVVDRAIEDLEQDLSREGREDYFRVFRKYELEGSHTYQEVATALGIGERDVGNYLLACRQRLREIIHARIRDYVESEEEARVESARIFALLTDPSRS